MKVKPVYSGLTQSYKSRVEARGVFTHSRKENKYNSEHFIDGAPFGGNKFSDGPTRGKRKKS